MNTNNDDNPTRRQWCGGAARFLALAGLSAISADLLMYKSGRKCQVPAACCDCAGRDECNLPEAVSFRRDRPATRSTRSDADVR